jgi:hypothetical protein
MSQIPNILPSERARLAAILGLLSSDKPGERDAAAHAATRFLRSRDLQWSDVFGAPALPAPEPQPMRDLSVLAEWPVRWRTAVQMCLQFSGDDREQAFLNNLSTYRQLNWLRSIAERVLAAEGAS